MLGSYNGSSFGSLACKGAASCKMNSDTATLTDNHEVWTQETRRDRSRVWEWTGACAVHLLKSQKGSIKENLLLIEKIVSELDGDLPFLLGLVNHLAKGLLLRRQARRKPC